MRIKSSRALTLTAFLAALLFGAALAGVTPETFFQPACAQQTGCPQMNVGGNTSLTWPAGATVKVFFGDSVPPDRRDAYVEVLNNWSQNNGQNVTFTTQVETGQTIYSMSVNDAVPNGDNSLRGQVTYQQWDGAGVLQFVDIQMNPNVTDPTALRNAFSHEVAHNFGLNHTANGSTSSQTASSLYNTANGLNDTSTGAPGPTNCDRQVINSTYAAGGVRYTAPVINDGGGGYGGGGGYDGGGYYDYPCTPYYWVYMESWDGGKTWDIVDVSYAGCW